MNSPGQPQPEKSNVLTKPYKLGNKALIFNGSLQILTYKNQTYMLYFVQICLSLYFQLIV